MSSQDFDKEDTTIYKVVVNHEEQYSMVARAQGESARLDRRRKDGDEGRMSRLHRRGLDRHEASELAKEDGGER